MYTVWFRVGGLEFGFQVSGMGLYTSWFRAWGLGSKVQGLGFQGSGLLGFRILGLGSEGLRVHAKPFEPSIKSHF